MTSPAGAAREAKRDIARLATPAGAFDASRYFRGSSNLRFHNVGMKRVRDVARAVHRAHDEVWSLHHAMACADVLMRDPHLETKGVGVELVARYRSEFTPAIVPRWKRWLSAGHSNNWATTDSICGLLLGPLVLQFPELAKTVGGWSRDTNLWVRRAAAVTLIPSVRRGRQLDCAYAVAARLHRDREDLIQKAVGWMLREAGKTDPLRLERYLRKNGPNIPRTTVRYAIERFDERRRQDLLRATKEIGGR